MAEPGTAAPGLPKPPVAAPADWGRAPLAPPRAPTAELTDEELRDKGAQGGESTLRRG